MMVIARTTGLRVRAAWLRPGAASASERSTFSSSNPSSSARGFASLVSSEWVKQSDRKLLIVDCEQPAAFQRAHIPSAQPFALASSGLKVLCTRSAIAVCVCCMSLMKVLLYML